VVDAVLPWADRFEPGRRYLVYAEPASQEDEFRIGALASYRIDEDDALVPLARQGKLRSEQGVGLKIAADRIRAASKKSATQKSFSRDLRHPSYRVPSG
jgi:hypothetical protein